MLRKVRYKKEMKILRGLALGLLGFLLFLSLIIFSSAFTVNSTALNPHFITSELDKIDVSALAEEFIGQEVPEEDLPQELRITVVDTINKLEPTVKERLNAYIDSVYDYLLGKKQSLDLALTLRSTFLNSGFVSSMLDQIDISSLADEIDVTSLVEEFISEQPSEEVPAEIKYLTPYVDVAIIELEPWIKEQVLIAADPTFDYLLGKSKSLKVLIPLEPIKQSIRGTVRQAFLKSPPADLAGLSPIALSQYYDDNVAEFADTMPSTFELNETELGTEAPAEISKALADAETGLREARHYIGYFQLGYWLLIVFILLLILGIVLIHQQVKGASRDIGIIFLTYGIPIFVGILIGKSLIKGIFTQPDIPAQLQTLLLQLSSDSLAPLEIFSISLMVIGMALLVVSLIYKPRAST
jgi:hypothetical protein